MRSFRSMALFGVLTATVACRSTAPYGVTSAAINTALAAGVSAHERAGGGCFAVCTHGTVCNPNTGYCERASGTCTPGAPGCGEGAREGMLNLEQPVTTRSEHLLKPALGVSPATGTVPTLPPATASPENR